MYHIAGVFGLANVGNASEVNERKSDILRHNTDNPDKKVTVDSNGVPVDTYFVYSSFHTYVEAFEALQICNSIVIENFTSKFFKGFVICRDGSPKANIYALNSMGQKLNNSVLLFQPIEVAMYATTDYNESFRLNKANTNISEDGGLITAVKYTYKIPRGDI